jgi:hypothetical protein
MTESVDVGALTAKSREIVGASKLKVEETLPTISPIVTYPL